MPQKTRAGASYIQRLERRVGVFHTSNILLIEAERELNESYRRYRLARKSTLAMQITWMKEIASRQAHNHGRISSSRLLTILHHEKQRKTHRIINTVMENIFLGSVTTVKFKLNCNAHECNPTSNKIGIERVFAAGNESKF